MMDDADASAGTLLCWVDDRRWGPGAKGGRGTQAKQRGKAKDVEDQPIDDGRTWIVEDVTMFGFGDVLASQGKRDSCLRGNTRHPGFIRLVCFVMDDRRRLPQTQEPTRATTSSLDVGLPAHALPRSFAFHRRLCGRPLLRKQVCLPRFLVADVLIVGHRRVFSFSCP